jgi:hypothetical protein
MTLGGSRRTKKRSCCNILLWIVIVTKEKNFDINEKGKKNSRRSKNEQKEVVKLTSPGHQKFRSQKLWRRRAPPDASFGLEVLEEIKSSIRFLFFSRFLSLEMAGGGDEVEPLSS